MSSQARRDVFQAIADPTRREILQLILQGPMNLNAIAGNFNISRPAVSQHIKLLTECGLIIIKDQGRERYCEVQPEGLAEIDGWLKPFRALWEHRFDKLDTLLHHLQHKKKQA